MKFNNKKIIVSTLALAMGAALAGSISGSVAWYQYSTRAAAQVSGTTAGTSRDLQVKVGSGEYGHYLNSTAILAGATKGSDGNLLPVGAMVTSSEEDGVQVTGFKGNPVYQYATLPNASTGWIEYNLSFKCEDNGVQVAKNVFVSSLTVTVGEAKILPAVRIAIDGGSKATRFVMANTAGSTTTTGPLDVGGKAGVDDTMEFDEQDAGTSKIQYTSGQASYTSTAWSDLVADFGSDPYTEPAGKAPVTTTKATTGDATITVKIWLEGWEDIDDKNCWDTATALNKSVQVDMRFECKADQ